MEVKLVITPSEEMVALVDKVINAFSKSYLVGEDPAGKKVVIDLSDAATDVKAPSIEDVGNTATTQVEEVFNPKKRRTKAEVEAEKQSLAEKAEAIEEAANQEEETTTETVELSFVPSVVKLRKMTVNRSEKIDDVPAKLMEFGYNSVTALAKDEDAAKRYYVYLISVSPLTDLDNE